MSIELTKEIEELLNSLINDKLARKLVILLENGKNFEEILVSLLNEMENMNTDEGELR